MIAKNLLNQTDNLLKELDTLSEQTTTMSAFIGFTQNPANIDWSAYHESFATIVKQYELSKPYCLRALEAGIPDEYRAE